MLRPLEDVTTMIDTVESDGNRLLVVQGTRKAGTRAPIHLHDYGGYTCVLTGVVTDYVEGQPPMTFPAGTCYYMPPDVPMTAANLGTDDARLIDNFTLPPGGVPMNVLESDWTAAIPFPETIDDPSRHGAKYRTSRSRFASRPNRWRAPNCGAG